MRLYVTFNKPYLFVSQRFIVIWHKTTHVKVDNLLGPYLYQYKRLSLPGIGVFTLDDKAVLPDEAAKVKTTIEGISFSSKTGQQLDDSLIMYIREQTGKMKPLAEADLYSYIATAFQYLNIGKPFYFEGIGTLQKNKDNGYTFSAGTVIPQRTEEVPLKHIETKQKPASAFVNEAPSGGGNVNAGKMVRVLVALVTLGIIGFGGYYLYNKNTDTTEPVNTQAANTQPASTPPSAPDTLAAKPDSNKVTTDSSRPDSAAAAAVTPQQNTATPPAPTGYKFIFETTDKKARAAKRYEQLKDVIVLKEFNNKVVVETKDSLSFNIYTIVPCTPADTARVKEQLNAWYWGTSAIKVKIGQ